MSNPPAASTESSVFPGAIASAPPSRNILGMRVDATSYPDAVRRIVNWTGDGRSRYVCVANVNNVMEAHDNRAFMAVMNGADLVTPDGVPLAWGLRWLGIESAGRVYGPDLTVSVLSAAAERGIPVGFYGGEPACLSDLMSVVRMRWPRLNVAYNYCPPFRQLTPDEDKEVIDEINASEARILLVGLGCPKQEVWMARHHGKLNCVMIGVGAAFDFISGRKKQAPRIVQSMGMEWAFRLMSEPKRLWKRYLKHNPRFVTLFGLQLLGLQQTQAFDGGRPSLDQRRELE
jgi:N-acetylglucosaminyldiphosphoundecaprenol N-acetyl-beta-D-mannosaminyltransferase